jgi:hypothetical protein
MQVLDHDKVSLRMAAAAEEIYDIVADVTRTPEFSPEVLRCRWVGGAEGPAVGARFKAVNRVARGPAWSNKPVVIAAERGREFAFSRTEPFGGTMVWRYTFVPDGTGAIVSESYDVVEPVKRPMWFLIERVCGRRDRRTDLREGMTQTLDRLRAAVEAKTAPHPNSVRPAPPGTR